MGAAVGTNEGVAVVGAAVVGTAVVGAAVVGTAVVGTAVVGTAVVGAAVVGVAVVGLNVGATEGAPVTQVNVVVVQPLVVHVASAPEALLKYGKVHVSVQDVPTALPAPQLLCTPLLTGSGAAPHVVAARVPRGVPSEQRNSRSASARTTHGAACFSATSARAATGYWKNRSSRENCTLTLAAE